MQEPAFTLCYRPYPSGATPRAVAAALRRRGHRVLETHGHGDLGAGPGEVLWVLGNPSWFPDVFRRLELLPRAARPLVVIWQTEPLPPPRASGLRWPLPTAREIARILLSNPDATDVYTNLRCLRRLTRRKLVDLLVTSTKARQEFLAERGIPSSFEPHGYEPSCGHDLGLERDIDVLFLGAPDVPRTRRQARRLRRRGIDVLALGSWTDPAYWGDNRNHLLNRARILLNLQRLPGLLSGARFILGMATRALVISEPVYQPAPFVPGKHYVSATVEEMPSVIRHYLAREDERREIVETAHGFVTKELTLERGVSRILELIAERLGS